MTGSVVVLGSINVDLLLSVERLPKAGETVLGSGVDRQLGGKGANQAVAAARAGAPCVLIAAVGADEDGGRMIAALAEAGVDVSQVSRVAAPTGLAVVATSSANNQIIVIAGANAELDATQVDAVAVAPGDVCLTQLESPIALVERFLRRAKAAGATTMLNPSPAHEAARALLPLVDVLLVNEHERDLLAPLALRPDQTLVVTLGEHGVSLARGGETRTVPGRKAEVVDTTGAGDCFAGYLAAALARGADLMDGLAEANAAAALSVQSKGAAPSMPQRADVLRALA